MRGLSLASDVPTTHAASEVFEMLRPGLERTPVLLASDFDGTLSDLVADPWRARILPTAQRALRLLAATPGIDVVFISGRVVMDLTDRVRIGGATYKGDHGAEWAELPRGFRLSAVRPVHEPVDRDVAAMAERLKTGVPASVAQPWLVLEDKGPALTFHYRSAPDLRAARAAVLTAVDEIDPGSVLHRRPGPRACELRPPGATTKGLALARLIDERRPGYAVMLGDDRNDAMAFDALRAARSDDTVDGLAIAVAGHSDITAQVAPQADVLLESPRETARLLMLLARHVVAAPRP